MDTTSLDADSFACSPVKFGGYMLAMPRNTTLTCGLRIPNTILGPLGDEILFILFTATDGSMAGFPLLIHHECIDNGILMTEHNWGK